MSAYGLQADLGGTAASMRQATLTTVNHGPLRTFVDCAAKVRFEPRADTTPNHLTLWVILVYALIHLAIVNRNSRL